MSVRCGLKSSQSSIVDPQPTPAVLLASWNGTRRISLLLQSGVALIVSLGLVFAAAAPAQAQSRIARSPKNMVATVHPLATAAGVDALAAGGNAVDAAVAAALTLGVVDGYNSGIGGGCFILIRSPAGEVFAIDARECAPAAAHREMYLRDGKAVPELSRHGALAVAVPGALAGYAEAAKQHGRLGLAQLILPAAGIAEQGFEIPETYARQIRGEREALHADPGCRRLLFGQDGQPLPAGYRLVQSDLANTYRQIASAGTDWFYRGPFADRLQDWMEEQGGVITARDMADYRTVSRQPLQTHYRGLTVYGFPPPSSGGIHVAQILQILESFDLARLEAEDPALVQHLIAQAMQLAFADRAHWLGDPDFARVPRGLVDPAYTASLAAQVELNRAKRFDSHGQPPAAESDFFQPRHTTHIAAADAEGWWVALTTTVNTTFGACAMVPGSGVFLNNQMDDFAAAPGVPNSFGLVGNEANAVAAGKRPLSSMSPTIICRDGVPIMTTGAAGGPKIISSTLLAIVRTVDLQQDLERAVGGPRLHHQWIPDRLLLEEGFPADQQQRLQSLGHPLETVAPAGFARCQAIVWDPAQGLFLGMADPRSDGTAASTDPEK